MSSPMAEADGRSLARETGRSAGKIGFSLLVAIALGYVLTLLATRWLGPQNSKVYLSFWGILMGLGSALSPLEQELSRQSAVAALDGGRAGKPALRALTVGAVTAAVVAALTLVVPVLSDRLYAGNTGLGVIVLCGAVAFACQFAARGLLVGQQRIKPYSGLVVAEAAVRVLVLFGVFFAGLTGLTSFAIAAATGSFAWLLFVRPVSRLVDPHADGEGWRPVTGRILVLMTGAALTASVITGYPAMVSLLAPGGSDAAVGVFFATLTVSRVPLLLLSPLQALAVPTVVRLSGTEDGRHRLRKLLAAGALGTVVVGVVGALAGWLIGPWLVKLLYGADFVAQGWWVAWMVWGAVVLTALQLMTAVLVARKQANKVLVTWAVVAVATAVVLLAAPGDPVFKAVSGLAVAPTLGLAVVLVFVLRRPAAQSQQG
ncbi:Membrane protein involved in the export of O-antigen and teichoic acid [Amycolatopsis australiensis]|uniref:Membrane protein involved in the export of O-antigen and teichoic acid n=2 Tax=Amycolatopsis australiensis TaxID=546364 RepID=A0A1K1QEL0_9PSEU|nr:Membrane protein involved in the export of O-antigen and teichoic acid [Amycolatopsis australiensis]